MNFLETSQVSNQNNNLVEMGLTSQSQQGY